MSQDTQQDKSKTGLRTSVHFVIIMKIGESQLPDSANNATLNMELCFSRENTRRSGLAHQPVEEDPLNKGSTQPTEPVVLRVAKTKTCSTDFLEGSG